MKEKMIAIVLTLTVSFFTTICLPVSKSKVEEKPKTDNSHEILTPVPKPQPRINGPLVYGCRPGNLFIYRIPCQGDCPIEVAQRQI